MADNTKIEWTDATWNPVTGCSVVSPGCTNCYAMRLAGTRMRNHPSRAGLTEPSRAGPVWNGQVRFNEEWLDQPLRWSKPRRIFVCAHGDLFHEAVPDDWIDRIFAVMALAPQHTFQILTKRAARMRQYLADGDAYHRLLRAAEPLRAKRPHLCRIPISDPRHGAFWPQIWLGVSAEDQARADERIPELLDTPAAIRFISAEPLLGPIDLARVCIVPRKPGSVRAGIHVDSLRNKHVESGLPRGLGTIAWVIAGGESGPDARPMHPEWARSLRDQCAAAGVPFFFKQWGEWAAARADLIPTAVDRQRWVGVDGTWMSGDAIDRVERDDRAGSPLSFKLMLLVGKRAAGRLLDGREHNDMPGAHA